MLDVNRIVRKSIPEKLMYLKNTELADKNKQKIKELLHEFFDKIYDKNYNDSEMNYFYDLVNLHIISFQDLDDIDKHLNNGKSTLRMGEFQSSSTSQEIPTNSIINDVYRELAPNIRSFCDNVKDFILNRDECKGCSLFGKPSVIVDTNVTDPGEVDIAFIGLNPGTEEVEVGKPFVGKAGKILRERLSLLPTDIKWAIYNIIPCHTKNENDIKNIEDVKIRCKDIFDGIKQTFPAKIMVPLGAKAFDVFGLKGSVGSLSGKMFKSNNQTIIPVMHPSSANYNPENLSKFKNDFQTVLNMFKTEKPQETIQTMKAPTQKYSSKNNAQEIIIPTNSNKYITQITPDLTFFDVRELGGKILRIFIDQTGQKKYMITDYTINFYVKNSSWRECDQIVSGIDNVVTISGQDKYRVIKNIKDKLNNLKGV